MNAKIENEMRALLDRSLRSACMTEAFYASVEHLNTRDVVLYFDERHGQGIDAFWAYDRIKLVATKDLPAVLRNKLGSPAPAEDGTPSFWLIAFLQEQFIVASVKLHPVGRHGGVV